MRVAYLDFSKAFSGLCPNSQVQVQELPDLFPKKKASVFLDFFAQVH